MRRNKLIRFFFNRLYRWQMPEFVQYWKNGDARAKPVILENGSYAMFIEGEKYPLMGFPRGPVLFGKLAELKYSCKNLVFNKVWEMLEERKDNLEIINYLKTVALPFLLKKVKECRYDMFPPEKLCPAVKEVWRVLSEMQKDAEDPKAFELLKKGITFFFQEDDAYRFRLQWVARYVDPHSWYRKLYRFFTRKPYSLKKELELVLKFLGNAEVTPDMKDRIVLIQRVLAVFLEDKEFGNLIEQFMWKANWKKIRLSKADTYFFRGKYFKVDHAVFDY